MTPVDFAESNKKFGPPPDLEESQCLTIPAYVGVIAGGSIDGSLVVVTAWQPSPDEIELIKQGQPIFLSFIGGLPPHFAGMSFQNAIHPA